MKSVFDREFFPNFLVKLKAVISFVVMILH